MFVMYNELCTLTVRSLIANQRRGIKFYPTLGSLLRVIAYRITSNGSPSMFVRGSGIQASRSLESDPLMLNAPPGTISYQLLPSLAPRRWLGVVIPDHSVPTVHDPLHWFIMAVPSRIRSRGLGIDADSMS